MTKKWSYVGKTQFSLQLRTLLVASRARFNSSSSLPIISTYDIIENKDHFSEEWSLFHVTERASVFIFRVPGLSAETLAES